MSSPSGPDQELYAEPSSTEEWQMVVDVSEALLLLDSARRYGLVTGGPATNIDRCIELLAGGAQRGIRPTRAGVDRVLKDLCDYRK